MDINWEIIAAGYLAKDTVQETMKRVFGPSLDLYGKGFADLQKKGAENVWRIVKSANSKLGDREGGIPPKIIKGIIQEGPYCNDEISAEYFGGILAASKSENPIDDRGVPILSLLSRMSVFEIRLHFWIYSQLRRLFLGQDFNIAASEIRKKIAIYIPYSEIEVIFGTQFGNRKDYYTSIYQSLFQLERERLIQNFFYGNKTHILDKYSIEVKEGGIAINPSTLGADLFLWAFGFSSVYSNELFSEKIELKIEDILDLKSKALIMDSPA